MFIYVYVYVCLYLRFGTAVAACIGGGTVYGNGNFAATAGFSNNIFIAWFWLMRFRFSSMMIFAITAAVAIVDIAVAVLMLCLFPIFYPSTVLISFTRVVSNVLEKLIRLPH